MTYVYQTNKQIGITYVYDNVPYWDKEKKQSRAKRKLIGKLDRLTGEIMPTRPYKKKELAIEPAAAKPGPHPITKTRQ